MTQYLIEGKYYNEYEEKSRQFYCVLIAENYVEVAEKMQKRFPYLSRYSVEEIYDGDEFVFMDKAHYEEFQKNYHSFESDEVEEEFECDM